MKYQIEETDVRVYLPEVLDLSTVKEQKTVLEEVLSLNRPVIFDAEKLKRIDLASLQLLVSFSITVKKLPVSWKGISPSLFQMASLLGMERYLKLADQGGETHVY